MGLEIINSLTDPKKEQETIILKDYLVEITQSKGYGGVLYLGYPIVSRGEENLKLDAIWISKEYGIIIFSILTSESSEENIKYEEEYQKRIYSGIYTKIINTDGLADVEIGSYPKPKINISVITFAPFLDSSKFIETGGWNPFKKEKNLQNYAFALTKDNLQEQIEKKGLFQIEADVYSRTISTIQDIINLKVIKKRKITKKFSKGSKLEKVEETMAQLDTKQEKTILGFFDGIQRIRGLAGSGKTIILALKVALFHSNNLEAKIAVTFNTRSQKQQFESYIKKFCISKMGREPDLDKIKIIQAWGSPSTEGVYYNFCIKNGLEYFDFTQSKNLRMAHYPDKELLDSVCTHALKELDAKGKEATELYDIIFIDEAQDLSSSFLKMCYDSLYRSKLGKRKLVYAYDELQKLNEGYSLPDPRDIFGVDVDSDDILYKCYRNSKEVITTAHALGLGIYREGGLVQFFDKSSLWKDIGYHTEKNESFMPNEETVLSRTGDSSPSFFSDYFTSDEFINFYKFNNTTDQCKWVADQIEKDIKEDDLLPGDIMVINPIALTTKHEVALIRRFLLEKGINSHITGESNADIFYQDGSIALTGINRAKGNEVGMVYIINANDCFKGKVNDKYDLQKLRNILFTSITRSKAWVRICGTGHSMDGLIGEFDKLKKCNYKLDFKYPSNKLIEELNTIYKTLNIEEESKLKNSKDELLKNINGIYQTLEKISKGTDSLENYSAEEQEFLKKFL